MLRCMKHGADHTRGCCISAFSIRLYQSTTRRFKNDNNIRLLDKLIPPAQYRPEMINKLLSTVQLFNNGISRLKVDFLNSLHIQEAELTRQHMLRKKRRDYEQRRQRLRMHERHGIHIVDELGKELTFIPSNQFTYPRNQQTYNNNSQSHYHHQKQLSSTTGNYLSTRRPQEHLRQISRDLQTTLPTVAAFLLIPFVGYTFLLLGMMFPRLLLSRQFHTREQRWDFATMEYSERRQWFEKLSIDFWGSCMIRRMPLLLVHDSRVDDGEEAVNEPEPYLDSLQMDAGGPVFNKQSMLTLYNLFQHNKSQGGRDASKILSINNLQSTHLHSLALSNNLAAPILLPFNLAPLFLQTCLPSLYLQQKLTTLAEDIIMDDSALIEEGQLESKCIGMTEEEILDACWLRGLPVGRFVTMNNNVQCSTHGREGEVEMMRTALTHHLQMIEDITKHSPLREIVRDSTLHLLVLHLPAIRYSMSK